MTADALPAPLDPLPPPHEAPPGARVFLGYATAADTRHGFPTLSQVYAVDLATGGVFHASAADRDPYSPDPAVRTVAALTRDWLVARLRGDWRVFGRDIATFVHTLACEAAMPSRRSCPLPEALAGGGPRWYDVAPLASAGLAAYRPLDSAPPEDLARFDALLAAWDAGPGPKAQTQVALYLARLNGLA